MNRLTILASIHRQLRDSYAETGEIRPLGEVVSQVASEIRSASAKPIPERADSHVISVEKISAFVDGELNGEDEHEIAEAIQFDNSVLAELIAAVRSTQVAMDDLPAVSFALSAQLRAMKPPTAISETDGADDSVRNSDQPTLVVLDTEHQHRSSRGKSERTKSRGPWMVAALAFAATVIAMIALWGLGGSDKPRRGLPERGVVEQMPESPIAPHQIPDVAPNVPEKSPPSQPIVENPVPQSVPASKDKIPMNPGASVAPESAVAGGDTRNPPMKPVNPAPSIDPKSRMTPENPIAIDLPKLSPPLKWTEVSGLLTVRNQVSDQATSRTAATWSSIQSGTTARSSEDNSNQPISIRTLPFSRAKGEFADGGGVVVASDTGLTMDDRTKDDAVIDLHYGSFAMINFGDDARVTLRQAEKPVTTLRWKGKATVVVARQASGFRIQVSGGRVEINSQSFKDKSVFVSEDQSVQTIRAPRRLARWVNSKDKNTPAEGLVLAQIASSDNVVSSIQQSINQMSTRQDVSPNDTNLIAKLASWQVSMAGAKFFRLTNSRVPIVRMAAFQRLAQLPESDPRHARAWAVVERSVNNPQRFIRFRSWFQLVQRGVRPNRVQLEQLVSGLSARDYVGRAAADFILRQYVANPPPFDPSWTNPARQRAVNVYRQRAGLAARPSAAGNAR